MTSLDLNTRKSKTLKIGAKESKINYFGGDLNTVSNHYRFISSVYSSFSNKTEKSTISIRNS